MAKKKPISQADLCSIVKGSRQLIRKGIAEGAYDGIAAPAWPERFLKELDALDKKHCKR